MYSAHLGAITRIVGGFQPLSLATETHSGDRSGREIIAISNPYQRKIAQACPAATRWHARVEVPDCTALAGERLAEFFKTLVP